MFRKNSYKLALAVGHILGDGGINSKGRVYYCNTEDFLINEFIDSMKIFNVNPWIKKEKNITRIVYPVKVGRKLWTVFGKFSSGKDTKIITPEIESMPLVLKTAILRAWFNDDGSVVNFPPNYKVIAIHQKLKRLIEFIQLVLAELNIDSKVIEDDRKWLLRITGYENIKKFKDKINFSKGYRKRKQLEEMISHITHPHFITKNKIIGLLKDTPKTIKEISQKLGMNRQVIYGHLHGWKRKKKKNNQGLTDLGLVKVKKIGRLNLYSRISSATTASCG